MFNFKDLKLKKKLIVYFLTVGVLPLAVVATVSFFIANTSFDKLAFNQLEAVQMIKKSQIEGFFNERMGDAEVFASLPFLQNALSELSTLADEAEADGYGGQRLVDYPEYKATFDKYHSFVKGYMEAYGYYDVFLFSPDDGTILLSAAMEADFGTSMRNESHHLAKGWQSMNSSKQPQFVDVGAYAPSAGAPAMFVVQPAYANGKYIGSIGLQVSDAAVNAIMQSRDGMGATGETYLVGSDLKMRSDSFLDPEGHSIKASIAGTVAKNGVDTKATRDALAGKDGREIIMDYNGNPVLSVYETLDLPSGVQWVVIAEIDEWEAFEASTSMRNWSIIIGLILGGLVAFFGFFIARSIANPLMDMSGIAKEVAVGNLESKVQKLSNDEIGELADSFNQVIASQLEKVDAAKAIAAGTMQEVELKSKNDHLSIAFNEEVKVIEELVEVMNTLVQDAKNGSLSERGDANKFNGAWKDLVEGVNDLLDAVILPVQEGSKVLEVMSTGDLTVRVTGDYQGDHQLIKNSINSLGDSVGGLIKQLTEAVEATASASTQISSSAEEMAAGAQEQSSQTAEVAAAMEEMSRTIVETANNATVSAEASQDASKKATEGSAKLEESKNGMQRIVTSTDTVGKNITSLASKSEQIGEIAQVIDDIADQTNLLALNAAIEAARAGEHGRGFAVVADEVRKLAENTTKATQEIAETIKAIQSEAKDADTSMKEAGEAVNDGLKLNDEVGDVLGEILSSVDSVTGQISQVAAASEEQSATAEQVSTNVEAINNVANESAAGVQQIASASEDLNRLTENLSGLVAQFKVSSGNSQNYSVGHNGNLLSE